MKHVLCMVWTVLWTMKHVLCMVWTVDNEACVVYGVDCRQCNMCCVWCVL